MQGPVEGFKEQWKEFQTEVGNFAGRVADTLSEKTADVLCGAGPQATTSKLSVGILRGALVSTAVTLVVVPPVGLAMLTGALGVLLGATARTAADTVSEYREQKAADEAAGAAGAGDATTAAASPAATQPSPVTTPIATGSAARVQVAALQDAAKKEEVEKNFQELKGEIEQYTNVGSKEELYSYLTNKYKNNEDALSAVLKEHSKEIIESLGDKAIDFITHALSQEAQTTDTASVFRGKGEIGLSFYTHYCNINFNDILNDCITTNNLNETRVEQFVDEIINKMQNHPKIEQFQKLNQAIASAAQTVNTRIPPKKEKFTDSPNRFAVTTFALRVLNPRCREASQQFSTKFQQQANFYVFSAQKISNYKTRNQEAVDLPDIAKKELDAIKKKKGLVQVISTKITKTEPEAVKQAQTKYDNAVSAAKKPENSLKELQEFKTTNEQVLEKLQTALLGPPSATAAASSAPADQ